MDLETENRIAAILLKEAAERRRQADSEGIHIYLQKPKVRARPNSRFLTATVLGVQQTNRAVEVNEMWGVRQKELKLNDRLKGRSEDGGRQGRSRGNDPSRSTSRMCDGSDSASCSSNKRLAEYSSSREDTGLRDEEIEEFLHSRIKRGRGSIGSRMDETGPYLPANSDSPVKLTTSPIEREQRVMLCPQKPSSLKSDKSSFDEKLHEHRRKKDKGRSESSDKKRSKKHKSKQESRDKKKKGKERRSKHHK